jgi:hypothetical protein
MDKHSSLLQKIVNYGSKKFYNIGSRSQIYDSIVVRRPRTKNDLKMIVRRFSNTHTSYSKQKTKFGKAELVKGNNKRWRKTSQTINFGLSYKLTREY